MTPSQWERTLAAQHDHYRRSGVACIHKTEPKRDMHGRFTEKAPPDFMGAMLGGRAVSFDAKLCRSAVWPLKNIKRHQARDLEAVWMLGGVSFIALHAWGRQWVLPWHWLRTRYQRWVQSDGPHALLEVDVTSYGIEIDNGDWLGAVRDWEVV